MEISVIFSSKDRCNYRETTAEISKEVFENEERSKCLEAENSKEQRHASMRLSGGSECVFVLYRELALLKGWTVVKKSLSSRKRILREH